MKPNIILHPLGCCCDDAVKVLETNLDKPQEDQTTLTLPSGMDADSWAPLLDEDMAQEYEQADGDNDTELLGLVLDHGKVCIGVVKLDAGQQDKSGSSYFVLDGKIVDGNCCWRRPPSGADDSESHLASLLRSNYQPCLVVRDAKREMLPLTPTSSQYTDEFSGFHELTAEELICV